LGADPREEHDRRVRADGTLDLGEHPLLTRFDELEIPKVELIVLDDPQNLAIAIIGRFDPID